MYIYLYAAYALCLIAQGIIITTKPFSEKAKTVISVASLFFGTTILILSFLEKSFTLAIAAVILYFILPGVSQTLTFFFTGQRRRISVISWAITILFLAAIVYFVAFAKTV